MLAAALLAGCQADSSMNKATPSPSPAASVMPSASPMPSTMPSAMPSASPSAAPANGYTATGLQRVLDGCLAYESGSAGTSLKAAIAANDLVRYLAQYAPGNTEPLRTDTKDWYDKLDEDKKALLKENWSGICATARQITDDPDEAKGVLESAGVSTDFSGVDLDAAAVGLDAVDGVLSADKAAS